MQHSVIKPGWWIKISSHRPFITVSHLITVDSFVLSCYLAAILFSWWQYFIYMCFNSDILLSLDLLHKFCSLIHFWPVTKWAVAIHKWSSLHSFNHLNPSCNAGIAIVSDRWQTQAGSFFPPAVELFRSGLPLGRSLLSLPDRYSELAAWQGSSGSSQNSQKHGLCLYPKSKQVRLRAALQTAWLGTLTNCIQ